MLNAFIFAVSSLKRPDAIAVGVTHAEQRRTRGKKEKPGRGSRSRARTPRHPGAGWSAILQEPVTSPKPPPHLTPRLIPEHKPLGISPGTSGVGGGIKPLGGGRSRATPKVRRGWGSGAGSPQPRGTREGPRGLPQPPRGAPRPPGPPRPPRGPRQGRAGGRAGAAQPVACAAAALNDLEGWGRLLRVLPSRALPPSILPFPPSAMGAGPASLCLSLSLCWALAPRARGAEEPRLQRGM